MVVATPPARVPKLPGWLWVDGELMLARTSDNTTVDGAPAKRISVIREGSGSLVLGSRRRAHQAGAAVTFSQPKGIYVHAKCMMIDDLFVSIGSANLNRRGFFHDGERRDATEGLLREHVVVEDLLALVLALVGDLERDLDHRVVLRALRALEADDIEQVVARRCELELATPRLDLAQIDVHLEIGEFLLCHDAFSPF